MTRRAAADNTATTSRVSSRILLLAVPIFVLAATGIGINLYESNVFWAVGLRGTPDPTGAEAGAAYTMHSLAAADEGRTVATVEASGEATAVKDKAAAAEVNVAKGGTKANLAKAEANLAVAKGAASSRGSWGPSAPLDLTIR